MMLSSSSTSLASLAPRFLPLVATAICSRDGVRLSSKVEVERDDWLLVLVLGWLYLDLRFDKDDD